MKKKNLFCLGLLAISLGFVAHLNKEENANQIVKADNEYNGSIIIKKNDNDMKYDGSKLVAYFFDAEQNAQHSGWGDAVSNINATYQEYSWTLDFEPNYMIMLRVDGANWSSANPWNNIWCRTGNVPLSGADVLWMNGDSNEGGGYGTYSTETFVMSKTDTVLGELPNKKVMHNNEGIEIFGQMTFSANQEFYIKKTIDGGAKYSSYDSLALISDNLSWNDGYIKVSEPATYELYFNFEEKTLYLTDPVIAAADEWAQGFLGSNCNASKGNWGRAASDYASLSSEAKVLLSGEEHIAYNAAANTYIKQAVQRYDYVLQLYGIDNANTDAAGYQDFMGRVNAGKLSLSPRFNGITVFEEGENSNFLGVMLISLTLVTAATAFLIIKKRKESITLK